jgi:hypothetical protein
MAFVNMTNYLEQMAMAKYPKDIDLKQSPLWQWDERLKRYRHRNGRFVGSKQLLTARDDFIQNVKQQTDNITEQLFNKDITIQQWQQQSRDLIRHSFVSEYVLAKGGRGNMTQSDWGKLGAMIRRQYQFHDNFTQQIINGRYTVNNLGSLKARLRLYMESSKQAFERAKSDGRGMPILSQVPGDGKTICRSNCKCHLTITETNTEWQVFWNLARAEHCPDCKRLEKQWNPLRVAKV